MPIFYEELTSNGDVQSLTADVYKSATVAEIWISGGIRYLSNGEHPSLSYGLYASGSNHGGAGQSNGPHMILKSPAEIKNFRWRNWFPMVSAKIRVQYRSGFRNEG